jgi:hypothetical protein
MDKESISEVLKLIKENEHDETYFPTVLAMPINRPFILTEEEAKEFLKNRPARSRAATMEEFREKRAEAKRKADKLRKKPERK